MHARNNDHEQQNQHNLDTLLFDKIGAAIYCSRLLTQLGGLQPLRHFLSSAARGAPLWRLALRAPTYDPNGEVTLDSSAPADTAVAVRGLGEHPVAELTWSNLDLPGEENVLDVTVTVDDATVVGTPDDTAALNLSITDVNEAPTLSLSNLVPSLAEDTDTLHLPIEGDPVATGMGNPHCTFFVEDAEAVVAGDALGSVERLWQTSLLRRIAGDPVRFTPYELGLALSLTVAPRSVRCMVMTCLATLQRLLLLRLRCKRFVQP